MDVNAQTPYIWSYHQFWNIILCCWSLVQDLQNRSQIDYPLKLLVDICDRMMPCTNCHDNPRMKVLANLPSQPLQVICVLLCKKLNICTSLYFLTNVCATSRISSKCALSLLYRISTKLGLSFPGNIRKGIRDWIKEQSNGKIQAKKSAKISKMKIKPRTIIISSSCS